MCDLITIIWLPKLSVAVGSVQVIDMTVWPGIAVKDIGSGQPVMTGGSSSTPIDVTKNKLVTKDEE